MSFLEWLGGVGSSLISGGLTSAINASQARKQREWQESMYEKQKGFWYEQQDYNSPSNQVQRLKEAGINPQFALGNIQSGQLGSSPSVGNGAAAVAGQFGDISQSVLNMMRGKNETRMANADIRDKNADAALKEIESVTKFQENLVKIDEILSRSGKNKSGQVKDYIDSMATRALAQADVTLKGIQGDELRSRIDLNVTQNEIFKTELQYLPEQKKLELAQLSSDIAWKIASKQLTLRQAKTEWFKQAEMSMRTTGQRLSNELMNRTWDNLVRKSYMDSLPSNPMQAAYRFATGGYWTQGLEE